MKDALPLRSKLLETKTSVNNHADALIFYTSICAAGVT